MADALGPAGKKKVADSQPTLKIQPGALAGPKPAVLPDTPAPGSQFIQLHSPHVLCPSLWCTANKHLFKEHIIEWAG